MGDNFYSVNGKNFCVQHKDVSLQHCSVCQDLISDGGLLISDQYYHLHCFTCTSCHQVLDGTYYTTDQGFLCKQCYMVRMKEGRGQEAGVRERETVPGSSAAATPD